ncbi:MAG: hypothetical protein AB1324_04945 [Candidatus Micrarchaeota archaeon]
MKLRASKKDEPDSGRGFVGRELLASGRLESGFRPRTKRYALSQALKGMGIEAEITSEEEKKLVTNFTIVIDGRERTIALGDTILEAADPIAEVQGVLRMFGLGALTTEKP